MSIKLNPAIIRKPSIYENLMQHIHIKHINIIFWFRSSEIDKEDLFAINFIKIENQTTDI